MSLFEGIIKEFAPFSTFAVDHFIHPECLTFFLSHFHSDHVKGLKSVKRPVRIFCSELTKCLLEAAPDYSGQSKYLIALPLGIPQDIQIASPQPEEEETEVIVTLIQAGHCLGSVMFLFEGKGRRVLYTGDFRLPLGRAKDIRPLHQGQEPLHLDGMYVDTTFFTKDPLPLPSRKVSADIVIEEVAKWLSGGRHRIVHLCPAAKFSYEFLYDLLRQRFGQKIHVTQKQYQSYGASDVTAGLTCDPNETQLHACNQFDTFCQNSPVLYCRRFSNKDEVLHIKTTTIQFLLVLRHSIFAAYFKTPNTARVCFTFHSSHEEVTDLVTYFKPKRAEACVQAIGDDALRQTQRRLDKLLATFREVHESKTGFGKLKKRTKTKGEVTSVQPSHLGAFGDEEEGEENEAEALSKEVATASRRSSEASDDSQATMLPEEMEVEEWILLSEDSQDETSSRSPSCQIVAITDS